MPIIFKMKCEKEKFKKKSKSNNSQMFATLGSFCCTISTGMVLGFSATLIPELHHPHSEIKINQNIASWIGMSHSNGF